MSRRIRLELILSFGYSLFNGYSICFGSFASFRSTLSRLCRYLTGVLVSLSISLMYFWWSSSRSSATASNISSAGFLGSSSSMSPIVFFFPEVSEALTPVRYFADWHEFALSNITYCTWTLTINNSAVRVLVPVLVTGMSLQHWALRVGVRQ